MNIQELQHCLTELNGTIASGAFNPIEAEAALDAVARVKPADKAAIRENYHKSSERLTKAIRNLVPLELESEHIDILDRGLNRLDEIYIAIQLLKATAWESYNLATLLTSGKVRVAYDRLMVRCIEAEEAALFYMRERSTFLRQHLC